jgi:hypothetical protein
MQPPNLQCSNAYVEYLRPSASKTITSATEARKVALLCGHDLDGLRVLAMASVVRLNGGPIDRILKDLMVCRGFG